MSLRPSLAAALALCLATPLAAKPVSLGLFGDWSAYSDGKGRKMLCFMTSRPASTKSDKPVNRGETYLQIQHDTGRKVKNETYVLAGFSYDESAPVTAKIDSRSFEMTPVKDAAWIFDPKTEAGFVAALKNGSSLTIKSKSARGRSITDSYSLKGAAGAYKAITNACKS